jgi:hypothetical protein
MPIIDKSWLPDKLEKGLPEVQRRFDAFERKFAAKFPSNSPDSSQASGIVWAMETPLMLLILGHNSAAIVELHADLERFTLMELTRQLSKNDAVSDLIWDLINRRTLHQVADMVIQLGLWDKSDKAFITRLKNIRDGVAHKNLELLSKHLRCGKPVKYEEVTELINTLDCATYFLNTVELFIKLIKRRPKVQENQ